MNQTAMFRTSLAVLMLCSFLASTVGGQASNYDQLVAQAQADLKAGNAAQALTESQKAIAAAPSRWEAYVVAGGALQVEQQYDEAVDDFTKALEHAPSAKKAAVRVLLEKCILAQTAAHSNPAPATTASTPAAQPASESSVSQAEVVLWKTIQNSTNPSDFQAYLQQYPNGAFASLARNSLTKLQMNQAAEQMKQLGAEYSAAYQLFYKGDFPGFAEGLKPPCDAGYANACTKLGELYETGQGVTQNYALAGQLLQKSCNGGDPHGCTDLGLLYLNGQGTATNYALAAALFQKACDGDDDIGCDYHLLYPNGDGVVIKSEALAAQIYQKACVAGDAYACEKSCNDGYAPSCTKLGSLYASGVGLVAKNAESARNFSERGCDGGDPDGCGYLGNLYANGFFGAKDVAMSVQLYVRACNMSADHEKHCTGVAYLYDHGGPNLPRDPALAAQFYQRSCNAGNTAACGILGDKYEQGDGVTQAADVAEQLYKKACADGHGLTYYCSK